MIWLKGVSKSFRTKSGLVWALREVGLAVQTGEFFVLLGPSGSGKTTLLRCVAGLEKPDSGEIGLGPRLMFSAKDNLFVPPEERELGMVFQSYAIWPHLTVFDNVALPLTQSKRRLHKVLAQERVREALQLVDMAGYEDRPAPLLSGGQQQRIALARALAVKPKALLMDEPLSNLDARLREEVRSKIKTLTKSLGITVLYVTHDQVEAMVLADRIAVMAEGEILQTGSGYDLYRSPVNPRVAEFFGSMSWFRGKAIDGARVETEIGILEVQDSIGAADPLVLGVRPEDIRVGSLSRQLENSFEAELLGRTFIGDQILLELKVGNRTLTAKTATDFEASGTKIPVHFPKAKIIVFAGRQVAA